MSNLGVDTNLDMSYLDLSKKDLFKIDGSIKLYVHIFNKERLHSYYH